MIEVVGIGDDGWAALPRHHQELVLRAPVVLGGVRHLAQLPPIEGQRRESWPTPLRTQLPALLADVGSGGVVVLASGDPLTSGVGTTLIELLGRDRVRIHPSISSETLARARMGWPAEETTVVSVVGRSPERLRRHLDPGARLVVLCADGSTPAAVAELLTGEGCGGSTMTAWWHLGGPSEGSRSGTARDWDSTPTPDLVILALEVDVLATMRPAVGPAPGRPEDAFDHDGQITKRDVRASALSRLQPTPGEHLWDVGAGSGSIGIEWMRAHPSCRTTAIEGHEERAARIERNAARLGVPGLRVVRGKAPEALAGLYAPDAVFIGGGATVPGVLDCCLEALKPGGRIVVHGVTLETEQCIAAAHRAHGGELTRLSVETSSPIGRFTGWTPARTITQWFWTRP